MTVFRFGEDGRMYVHGQEVVLASDEFEHRPKGLHEQRDLSAHIHLLEPPSGPEVTPLWHASSTVRPMTRRERLSGWLHGRREALALRIAPWLERGW